MKVKDISVVCSPELCTPALNYVVLQPGKPVTSKLTPPSWLQPKDDSLYILVEQLTEGGWRVDHIRQQITFLGLKPKGVRRAELVRQLIEGFLDRERLRRQLSTLNDEERSFYFHLLLHIKLSNLRTRPTAVERVLSLSTPPNLLIQRLLDAGLGLRDQSENFFVPVEMPKSLLPFSLPMAPESAPTTYVPAADPRLLLIRIHQWLNQAQSGAYHIRPRLRWRLPHMGYTGSDAHIWPPVPKDAQRLLSNINRQSLITLCPPEPYLDEPSLTTLSAELEFPADNIEFLYHLLVNAQLLLPGNPVTPNGALLPSWLTQTAAKQATFLYGVYCSLSDWAEWWPAWRNGDISIQWSHQNYWTMPSMENTLSQTHRMLRESFLAILSYLPHEVWLSIDNVMRFVMKLYPEPQTHLYQQNLQCRGAGSWEGFLRHVLKAMLRGPLYVLGLADVAPHLDDIVLFRLHHLQEVHLGYAEMPLPEDVAGFSREHVEFVPQEQILLITPPARAEFFDLVQQWSEPRGLSQGRLHYQLNVSRLHKAFEQGETPETLAATWEKCAGFAPPPDIQAWWQTWWARYGHIRLYTGQTVLVTRDEFTLQELQVALPKMRESIMGLVTPRVALLQTTQVDQIVSDLMRQGYMPKEE